MSDQVTTIQSPDLKKFDNMSNVHLNLGGEIVSGSYQVIQQDEVVLYSQVIKYDKKKYYVSFGDNGDIESYTKILVWGIRHGLHLEWNNDGTVGTKGRYVLGRKHGLLVSTTPSSIRLEEIYFWGYKHGENSLYQDNFRFHSSEYRWGKQHGPSIGYSKTRGHGQVSDITHYKRGLKHGEYTDYPRGSSFYNREHGHYKHGNKHGYWIKENLDGEVLEKIKWSRGVKHGFCVEYDDKNNLTGKGKYKYDFKHGNWVWYDGDEIIREEIMNEWNELDDYYKEFSRDRYRSESVLMYWIDKFTPNN
jgi:antitoxin component YwqK of YwqJK toxin-antitoxin module